MNEYQQLVKDARKKQLALTTDQFNQIRSLYSDVAKDLKRKANKANKGSLTQGWLKDYRKAILSDMKQLNNTLQSKITDGIGASANIASSVQLSFFDKINLKYGLGMDKTFRTMFSNVNIDTVKEMINGDFYKDGKGLSKRIWFTGSKVNGNIDYIIQQGLLEKKSAYDLSNDLQTYVDPYAQKDWDWKQVYPNASATVDYCAQRLARTSITHAYSLATLKSCEKNPYVTKVMWHSVLSSRTCELCSDRDGETYTLDECPVDHPNGMCYQEPLLDKSIEDIGSDLGDWVNGDSGSNPMLDDWYAKYGDEFSS